MNPFRKAPIASLLAVATVMLATLTTLQGTGLLHGKAAAWVDAVVGLLNVLLGLYARTHATPIDNPKDRAGRPLVPVAPPAGNYSATG